eukprot:COSAG01_NODE_30796_length_609_cov_1.296078_1_plen_83_part_10
MSRLFLTRNNLFAETVGVLRPAMQERMQQFRAAEVGVRQRLARGAERLAGLEAWAALLVERASQPRAAALELQSTAAVLRGWL